MMEALPKVGANSLRECRKKQDSGETETETQLPFQVYVRALEKMLCTQTNLLVHHGTCHEVQVWW